MAINTNTILQGKGEVSLREAYSTLENNGIAARTLDSTYMNLDAIQDIALMILGMSCLFSLLCSVYLVTPAKFIGAKIIAGSLGFGAAAGLVTLAAYCVKHYHLSSVKLNASQVNQLLKNV